MSTPDHFYRDGDGREYAGRHMVMDLWGCDPGIIANAVDVTMGIWQAVEAMGATMLGRPVARQFPDGGGVTAFAILAESHIAVHTWPERGYVAADVFTCGDTPAGPAFDALWGVYGATRADRRAVMRGYEGWSRSIPAPLPPGF